MPGIAILILNWNNYPDTKRCLESLKRLTYPNLSIVLLDNGSTDHSGVKLSSEFPNIHTIFTEENLGFAGGNNVGIQHILEQGIPFILLLNNDTEVNNPDFLQDLVQEISSDNTVAAIGPRVQRYDSSEQDTILPYPTLTNTIICTLGLYRNDLSQKQYADSISGCCVLVRAAAIEQAGLLDGNIFFYGEETEWFFRMRLKGWKIAFLPVDSILHKGAASSANLVDRNIYVERRSNVIYTLVKHEQYVPAILTAILMFLLMSVRIFLSLPKAPQNRYDVGMIPEFFKATYEKWILARSALNNISTGKSLPEFK